MAMKPTLSKQQEVVLARALSEGGTCRSSAAYAALVDLGGTLAESDEQLVESEAKSILLNVGDILQSLVELGLMVKSGPGKYDLTKEGSRVAENLAEKYPFA
jgi:hypothetical protein